MLIAMHVVLLYSKRSLKLNYDQKSKKQTHLQRERARQGKRYKHRECKSVKEKESVCEGESERERGS